MGKNYLIKIMHYNHMFKKKILIKMIFYKNNYYNNKYKLYNIYITLNYIILYYIYIIFKNLGFAMIKYILFNLNYIHNIMSINENISPLITNDTNGISLI